MQCRRCKVKVGKWQNYCSFKCHLLEKKIEKNGCWEWERRHDRKGYGQLAVRENGKKKNKQVHRLSYEAFVGPIPEGLCVLHKCDNPKCYRPEHLWLGTYKDNNQDAQKKGRHRYGQCLGSKHYNAKLTEKEVREIRKLSAQGVKDMDLSEQFGVNDRCIGMIRRRETWKHVL